MRVVIQIYIKIIQFKFIFSDIQAFKPAYIVSIRGDCTWPEFGRSALGHERALEAKESPRCRQSLAPH